MCTSWPVAAEGYNPSKQIEPITNLKVNLTTRLAGTEGLLTDIPHLEIETAKDGILFLGYALDSSGYKI